jgi:type IV pilus assembly protein PilW
MNKPIPIARSGGFTLIELMVAMVLGILVAGGIITVFLSTSSSNKVQTQLARMQEDGRFAIGQLNDDLAMATGMYCNNTGGVAQATPDGKVFLDGLRTPRIFAKQFLEAPALSDSTTLWGQTSGGNTYPVAPVATYSMPSFLFMRGYTCPASGNCLPIEPAFLGGDAATSGTAMGNRVIGTDVLTVRYLDSSRGWRLGGNNTVTANPDGTLKNILLSPSATEPPVTDFKSSFALLADCSNSQVFRVTGKGSSTLTPDAANNFEKPLALQPQAAPRLFDFVTDMRNVTYFVQVVTDDGSATGKKTGALMRRVNGATADQELIRGVERLTFRYGVEDSTGNVMFLTADQVDSRNGGALTCPPTATALGTSDPGCLWRAVKSIQASILVAGQATLYNLTDPELGFVYSPDSVAGTNDIVTPSTTDKKMLAIQPKTQGFDDKRLRREFTTVVSLRNYNP